MRALVCGVTGQDGSYLARLLLDKGYEVWGTSRDAQAPTIGNVAALSLAPDLKLVSMAPNDMGSVRSVVDRSDPDEIYFLAGQSSVGLSFEQPAQTLDSIVTAVLNLLEVIRPRAKPVRLYNASSSECFGDTGPAAADEATPFRPLSPYAVAKSAAHWLVADYRRSYGLYACNGILFNHESPLRPQRFVTQKVVQAASRIARGSGERLTLGRLDIHRDWGWAPEYVEAIWRMLQQESPEDFLIATGETRSLSEFVAAAFEEFGMEWQSHVDVSPQLRRPTDIGQSRGNPARARERLGWSARHRMRDVVRMMADALRGPG